jgi:hypothetical protein
MTRIGSIIFAFASWVAIVGFLSFFPTAASAQQVCRWQVDGKWTAYQRRDGNTVAINLNLTQTRNLFSGSAFTPSIGSGAVNGTINDRDFTGLIKWKDGRRSAYNGTVHPQWNGNQPVIVLEGTSFGVEDPFTLYQWWKSTLMISHCTHD